ncbi:hypothetical protein [Derxia gummosa]|uniref:Uncharacterized protein n=1 Tax=Derxia gummosa DSM 723 TaxID=1121388 RepID=A0A8B6XCP3_9BURK|nr:hypothetical protein [Derxia gummosa]
MALQKLTTTEGEFVKAADAEKIETVLSKLVWEVLYGKAFDAQAAAMAAERALAEVKA